MQADMPSDRCTKEREKVPRLSTLFVSPSDVSGISNQVHFYMDLERPFDVFRFLKNLGCWGRDCDFGSGMRRVHCPVFVRWHNIGMFAVPNLVANSYIRRFSNVGLAVTAVAS